MHIVGRITAKSISSKGSTCNSKTKLHCTPTATVHSMVPVASGITAVRNYQPVGPIHSGMGSMPSMVVPMRSSGTRTISVYGFSGGGVSQGTYWETGLTLHDGAPQRPSLRVGTDVTLTPTFALSKSSLIRPFAVRRLFLSKKVFWEFV